MQHREAQGFESVSFFFWVDSNVAHVIFFQNRFKSVFPDGLIIKKGGMESGLKKAETNVHEPKLFKVAGGSRPVMTEVSFRVRVNDAGSSSQHNSCLKGSNGLVVYEPWRCLRPRLWQEDLCMERL